LIGSIAIASLLALSACSSGDSNSSTTSAPPADTSSAAQSEPAAGGDQITLTISFWDPNYEPGFQAAIDLFEQANPNVTVQYTTTPSSDYWTTVQTQIGAGAGFDVFAMNAPQFPTYAANGALLPLTGLFDTSNYPQATIDIVTWDGEVYGVPNNYDTIGVYYNKRLFDLAGVEYPTAGWTWDDFKNAVAKTTGIEDGVYGTASAPYGQMTYYNTILQAGGYLFTQTDNGFGTQGAIDGVKLWTDFIDEGYSPTLQQITDTWPGDSFGDGKLAMFWDGSWGAKTYAESAQGEYIDVAPMPMGSANDHCVLNGISFVVNKNTPNADAAKALAVFMGSKEAAEILATYGVAIPSYNGTQQAWVDALPSMDAQVLIDAAATADPYPVAPLREMGYGTIEGDAITAIFGRTADPATAMPEMAAALQAVIDSE
jgi:multiple sugar transport system substrate-binding protein